MKKLLAVFAVALSFSAVAADQKVSFSYSGIESWGRSYYSCDYAEAQAEKHLEVLGATNVDVRCTGGIEFGQMWPINLTATFDLPVLSGREIAEVVTIKGRRPNPACGLNTKMIKAFLPKFSNVTVVSKRDACFSPDSVYSYELSIVR